MSIKSASFKLIFDYFPTSLSVPPPYQLSKQQSLMIQQFQRFMSRRQSIQIDCPQRMTRTISRIFKSNSTPIIHMILQTQNKDMLASSNADKKIDQIKRMIFADIHSLLKALIWFLQTIEQFEEHQIYCPSLITHYDNTEKINREWVSRMVNHKKSLQKSCGGDADMMDITYFIGNIFGSQGSAQIQIKNMEVDFFIEFQKKSRCHSNFEDENIFTSPDYKKQLMHQLHQESLVILQRIEESFLTRESNKNQLQSMKTIYALFLSLMLVEHHQQILTILRYVKRKRLFEPHLVEQLTNLQDQYSNLDINIIDWKNNWTQLKGLYQASKKKWQQFRRRLREVILKIQKIVYENTSGINEITLDQFLNSEYFNLTLCQHPAKQVVDDGITYKRINIVETQSWIKNDSKESKELKVINLMKYLRKRHEIEIIKYLGTKQLSSIIAPLSFTISSKDNRIKQVQYYLTKGEDFSRQQCRQKKYVYDLIRTSVKACEELQRLNLYYTDFHLGNFVQFKYELRLIDFNDCFLLRDDFLRYLIRTLLIFQSNSSHPQYFCSIQFLFRRHVDQFDYLKKQFHKTLKSVDSKCEAMRLHITHYEDRCLQIIRQEVKQNHLKELTAMIVSLIRSDKAKAVMTKTERYKILAAVERLQKTGCFNYQKRYSTFLADIDKIEKTCEKLEVSQVSTNSMSQDRQLQAQLVTFHKKSLELSQTLSRMGNLRFNETVKEDLGKINTRIQEMIRLIKNESYRRLI